MAAVGVFCASGLDIDQRYLDLARAVGTELARRGHTLVSGGGHISMMGAVADGARAGGAYTVGVMPETLVALEIADTASDEQRDAPPPDHLCSLFGDGGFGAGRPRRGDVGISVNRRARGGLDGGSGGEAGGPGERSGVCPTAAAGGTAGAARVMCGGGHIQPASAPPVSICDQHPLSVAAIRYPQLTHSRCCAGTAVGGGFGSTIIGRPPSPPAGPSPQCRAATLAGPNPAP